MDEYLWQYILKCDPFAKKEDVLEIKELNEWDLLIVFKNGTKIIYDRFTNYHKNIFYDNIEELTDEQEMKEFAYRLRTMMKRRHIVQDELAERVGTNQAMISRYINGESIPNVLTVRKIAKALDCSMDDLFYKEY